MNIDNQTLVAIGGVITTALGFLGFKKAKRSEQVADADTELSVLCTGAYKELLECVRAEVARMAAETTRTSDINDALTKKVGDFQIENIQLRAEIAMLTAQVSAFQAQIAQLLDEIEKLKKPAGSPPPEGDPFDMGVGV